MGAILVVIGFILAILVSSAIVNTMLMSVYERVREIGTMMAIGVRRRQVLAIFLFESATLGLVAATVGAAAGLGLVRLFAGGIHMPATTLSGPLLIVPHVGARWLLTSALVAALGATLAALYPAWKASRMRPSTPCAKAETPTQSRSPLPRIPRLPARGRGPAGTCAAVACRNWMPHSPSVLTVGRVGRLALLVLAVAAVAGVRHRRQEPPLAVESPRLIWTELLSLGSIEQWPPDERVCSPRNHRSPLFRTRIVYDFDDEGIVPGAPGPNVAAREDPSSLREAGDFAEVLDERSDLLRR